MTQEPSSQNQKSGLNPALKSRMETTHDTGTSSKAPVETATVQREEGRAWPAIWLVVTIVGLLILIYLAFG